MSDQLLKTMKAAKTAYLLFQRDNQLEKHCTVLATRPSFFKVLKALDLVADYNEVKTCIANHLFLNALVTAAAGLDSAVS